MRLRAALVPLAFTVVLAAGCSSAHSTGIASADGGKSSTTATGTSAGPADAGSAGRKYAQCMRDHGIDMPDPKVGSNGDVGIGLPDGVDPNGATFKSAQSACQGLLPNGGQPSAEDPKTQAARLAFARCMRAHGVDMPDPGSGPVVHSGGPGDSNNAVGVNPDSPAFKQGFAACKNLLPAGDGPALNTGGN